MTMEAIDASLEFALSVELGADDKNLLQRTCRVSKNCTRMNGHSVDTPDSVESALLLKSAKTFTDVQTEAYGSALLLSGALSTMASSLMSYRVDGAPCDAGQKHLLPGGKWSAQAQQCQGSNATTVTEWRHCFIIWRSRSSALPFERSGLQTSRSCSYSRSHSAMLTVLAATCPSQRCR